MWQCWASEAFHHGYYRADAEAHHHTENFTRVVARLWLVDRLDESYRSALLDLAHHLGNWEPGVPAWYDWEAHRFRDGYLGTQRVGGTACTPARTASTAFAT